MGKPPVAVAAVALDRLRPAPWNPRILRDARFKSLCRSIQADPDFLWHRPVLAMEDGTIYAGNMRYRAACELGLAEIPAIVGPVGEALARTRALRDNQSWGEWDEDALAELLFGLTASEEDIADLGFEEVELARLLGSVGVGEFDIEQAWGGMPEYVQDNLQSAYSLHVHFADAESFAAFTELIGQPHVRATARSIWFPAQENTPFGAVKAGDDGAA